MDNSRNILAVPPLPPILTARRRVVIACTNCRRRKIRCATDLEHDIPRNPCERCVKKGLKCEYITVADQFSTPPASALPNLSPTNAPAQSFYQLPSSQAEPRAPFPPHPPPGSTHHYLPHPDSRHHINFAPVPPLEIVQSKPPSDSQRLPSFREFYAAHPRPGSPETVRLPPLRRCRICQKVPCLEHP